VNEQQAGGPRRRRSRAEADQLVAEYEASGLSRQQFCQERGLALTTLDRYRKRRRQAGTDVAGGAGWMAVELSAPKQVAGNGAASGLAVVLSRGRRIEIGCGFDAITLAQLLRVLETA
jgi:hypothetical protein